MRLSLSTFRRLLFSGLAVLIGLLAGNLRAQNTAPGRSIELSAPASVEMLTNFNHSAAQQEGRKQLEADLFKQRRLFPDNNSLGGMLAPQLPNPTAMPVIRSKRVQELLERRKNWIFMSPEDLTSAPSAEELLNLPEYSKDGQEKKMLSPLERYYQNLERGSKTATVKSKFQDDDAFGFRDRDASRLDSGQRDAANLSGDGSDNERNLKRSLNPDADRDGQVPARSSFSDIFGLANVKPLAGHDEVHKLRMEQFKTQILGLPPSLPAAGIDPGNSLQSLIAPTPRAPAPPGAPVYGNSGSIGQIGFGQQSVAVNPLSLPGSPDAGQNSFGLSSPSPPPPKVEQPRLTPPAPTFTVPQRKF